LLNKYISFLDIDEEKKRLKNLLKKNQRKFKEKGYDKSKKNELT